MFSKAVLKWSQKSPIIEPKTGFQSIRMTLSRISNKGRLKCFWTLNMEWFTSHPKIQESVLFWVLFDYYQRNYVNVSGRLWRISTGSNGTSRFVERPQVVEVSENVKSVFAHIFCFTGNVKSPGHIIKRRIPEVISLDNWSQIVLIPINALT